VCSLSVTPSWIVSSFSIRVILSMYLSNRIARVQLDSQLGLFPMIGALASLFLVFSVVREEQPAKFVVCLPWTARVCRSPQGPERSRERM
jgi:inner membrane protein involved in colicin E2 resistance